jgi:hypothetical protein
MLEEKGSGLTKPLGRGKSEKMLDLNEHYRVLARFIKETGIGGDAKCRTCIETTLFSVVGRVERPARSKNTVFFEIALAGIIGYVEWCKQIPYVPKGTYGKDLDAHKEIVERAARWLSNNVDWLDPESAEDNLWYLYDSLGPPSSLPRHQNKKKS